MPSRAPALPPEERRAQLECAAVRVLHERGLAATSKEMAAAAGVAEGTIFRVFESKEALVQAALRRAFDLDPLVARVEAIEAGLPLRERLVELVRALQERYVDLFELMSAVGMIRPPEDVHAEVHEQQARLAERMVELVAPDAALLRVAPEQLVRLLRLLTFSGSNRHIARGDLLTPDDIVDALLDGTRKAAPPC